MPFASPLFKAADDPQELESSFRGLPLVIEWPKGSIREGTDPEGNHWKRKMYCDYGYIEDTSGSGDKEPLDVYVGEDEAAEEVYIIEQKGDGEPDEFKLVLGAPDMQAAVDLYLKHYPAGWEDHILNVYDVPFEELFGAVREYQTKQAHSSDPIFQFIDQYDRAWYEQIADSVRRVLTEALLERGIRAVVSSRGKAVDSLQTKLLKRNQINPYRDIQEIALDIKDLAGVRVALYFPIDVEAVQAIIQQIFIQARDPKNFPQDKEPSEPEGYRATHYCVLVEGTLVEIQVSSALMFAWAEVAHDLLYKPLRGPLTFQEQEILDDLLSLVTAGEIAVMELHQSLNQRTVNELEFQMQARCRYKSASIGLQSKQYLPLFAHALEDVLHPKQGYNWPNPSPDNLAFQKALKEVGKGKGYGDLSPEEQAEIRRLAQKYKQDYAQNSTVRQTT